MRFIRLLELTVLVLFCFARFATFGVTQEPELVVNLNTYPNTGYGGDSIVYNGKIYLAFEDAANGRELFVLADENSTPQLVKDIDPGTESSFPRNFAVANGLLFFTADTAALGRELWTSDGTEAGTKLLLELWVGGGGFSRITQLTPFNGASRLGFRADSNVFGSDFGEEICQTDGTVIGTICHNIRPGNLDSRPDHLTAVGTSLFFAANDGTIGEEFWGLLGVGAVLTLIDDINPGAGSSIPSSFTPFGVGGVLFHARDGVANGNELWFSTGPGTSTMVLDIDPAGSSNPGNIVALSPTFALFSARTALGSELWKTDGTGPGTSIVKDINVGSTGSNPNSLVALGSQVLFTADDGLKGRELWKSDGTLAGTTLVKDIEPGSEESQIDQLTVIAGKGFLRAKTSLLGQEPWVTDGTTAGTQVLQDLRAGEGGSFPRDFTEFNSRTFFVANADNEPGAHFLNAANTTIANTVSLVGVGDGGSEIFNFFPINDQYVYFQRFDIDTGEEPWVLDIVNGTANILADIMPGAKGSFPNFMGVVDEIAIFSAFDSVNGRELWTTDGTQAGTALLLDLFPGVTSSGAYGVGSGGLVFNGNVYFAANTPASGTELWKTDGTLLGTSQVKDINPGVGDGNPQSAAQALGVLFFSADNGIDGKELWKTDGTGAGTVLVKNINPGGSSFAGKVYEHDNLAFFRADDGTNGSELWMSDGTNAGTNLSANVYAGAPGSHPGDFFTLGSKLLFSAKVLVDGEVLMSIEAPYNIGAVNFVKDPDPTGLTTHINHITDVFGTVLFSAIIPAQGIDLWTTDGTPAGTNPFVIINPILGSPAGLKGFYEAGDYFYFSAQDGVVGSEPWRTDGTVVGTMLVKDLDPGRADSNPNFFPAHRGALYFTARTKQFGGELWKFVFDECPDDDNKVVLGVCGCGVVDVDNDADGTFDCLEECPTDPAKTLAGQCGCGVPDTDSDGDGSVDCSDICPGDALKFTAGVCGCGVEDSDLNVNGVADCLVNQDLSKLIDDAIEAIQLLGKKKKKLSALGLTKKELKKKVKEFAGQLSNYQVTSLTISTDQVKFTKKKGQAAKSMRKATRLGSKTFKSLKKKALRKLGKLKKLLA